MAVGLSYADMIKAEERQSVITKVTGVGIITNLILVVFKMLAGLASGSVSIVNDAVNNAADCVSSVVTMTFYSLGRKRPTRKHPLGYGRMEYLSALIVSFLVIITGFQCLTSSVDAIRNPSAVSLSAAGYVIIAASIAAKVFLSILNTKQGKKINSDSLIATGKDALSDVLVTALTLVSALFSPLTGFPVDGAAGIIVSLFILYSGFSSVQETVSSIMGERPSEETVNKIRSIIEKHPPLKGGYDIMLHNYGPERTLGTCNVEVPIDTHAEDIFDAMTDTTKDIMDQLGIYMTFGMYAVNDYRADVREMKEKVLEIMKTTSHHVLSLHAFHVHFDTHMVHFDVVVDFNVKNSVNLKNKLTKALKLYYPDYSFEFTIDPEYG